MGSSSPRTLLVVSHVVHYRDGGRLFAYAPYAREIDVWADLFPELVIASPCRDEVPPGDCAPFSRTNIAIRPLKEAGGESLRAKLGLLCSLPGTIRNLAESMRTADAIHVRCPGNMGLLGVLLGPLYSRKLVAKYAGQWSDYQGEALTYRLQKALLRSRWWRGPVTVYGVWPAQPPHVVPFFTSVMTAEQLDRARRAAATARPGGPARVLYIGRLSAAKNVDVLLAAVAALRSLDVACECTVVGDGPLRTPLEAQVERLGLGDRVTRAGAVSHERVHDHLERSDVLVLASESEGWPKAIAEAMAFGLVCIGSDRGLVPQMLGEGRGMVVSPGDVAALVDALGRVARGPDDFVEMRSRAARWAQSYSLEGLRDALTALLKERWGVSLAGHPGGDGS